MSRVGIDEEGFAWDYAGFFGKAGIGIDAQNSVLAVRGGQFIVPETDDCLLPMLQYAIQEF